MTEERWIELLREMMETFVIPRVREQILDDLDRRIERIVVQQLRQIHPDLMMDIGL